MQVCKDQQVQWGDAVDFNCEDFWIDVGLDSPYDFLSYNPETN